MAMSPALLSLAFVIGIAASIVGAALPARQAARMDPIQALRKGRLYSLSAVKVVCAPWQRQCWRLSQSSAWSPPVHVVIFYSGYLLAMVAALLLGPVLTLGLAKRYDRC